MPDTAKYTSRCRCVFQAMVATRSPCLMPELLEGVGELPRTPADLAPGRTMNRTLDRPRDDLGRTVKTCGELDLVGDEQLQIHHLPEHSQPSSVGSEQ